MLLCRVQVRPACYFVEEGRLLPNFVVLEVLLERRSIQAEATTLLPWSAGVADHRRHEVESPVLSCCNLASVLPLATFVTFVTVLSCCCYREDGACRCLEGSSPNRKCNHRRDHLTQGFPPWSIATVRKDYVGVHFVPHSLVAEESPQRAADTNKALPIGDSSGHRISLPGLTTLSPVGATDRRRSPLPVKSTRQGDLWEKKRRRRLNGSGPVIGIDHLGADQIRLDCDRVHKPDRA